MAERIRMTSGLSAILRLASQQQLSQKRYLVMSLRP
jgi:hypothetical protein